MRGLPKGRGKSLARLALPGLAVVTASLLLAGKTTRQRIGNPVVPEPLKPVELPRYLGRWYEFARYDNRFEWHCEAVTADYAQRPDGLISVVNTAHRGGPDGRVRVATARAKIVPGSGNAKLRLSFLDRFSGHITGCWTMTMIIIGRWWANPRADISGF